MAKAKAKAKAIGAEGEEQKDPKRKKTDQVECKEVKNGDIQEEQRKTFARRYAPRDGVQLIKFDVIEETYQTEIAHKLNRQSAFQDSWVAYSMFKFPVLSF